MRKALYFLGLSIVLSAALYPLKIPVDKSYISTLHTTASIMFSIGMGVICTFNPEKIKNKNIYNNIKNKVIALRTNFLWVFGITTTGFTAVQAISSNVTLNLGSVTLHVQPALDIFCAVLLIISMCYFILNFLSMQSLVFEIHETD